MVKKLIITRWCRQKSKLLPLAIRRHWEQKPPFCIHLGFHLLSASLQFPADCKLLRSLEKPPTAIWRSMIIWSFLGVPNPLLHLFFSPNRTASSSSLMGRAFHARLWSPVWHTSWARRGRVPSALRLTKKVMESVASPFSSLLLTRALPSFTICHHIVVNKWMQSVVSARPVPISDRLFRTLNSSRRRSPLIYSSFVWDPSCGRDLGFTPPCSCAVL